MLKLVGSFLIMVACVGLGSLGKKALNQRLQALRSLLYGLQAIETEIKYGVNPLPRVLVNAGVEAEGKIGEFLQQTGNQLQTSSGQTVWEIWQHNLAKYRDELGLKLSDLQVLLSFGRGLGTSNVEDQMRRLGLAQTEVKKRLSEAEAELGKMGKFWLSLGWGGGIVLVLLWL